MNELNEKMAEFVWGKDKVKLLWGHTDECGDFSLVPPGYNKEKFDTEQALCFLYPDSPYSVWEVVPDFPNDLNACFKWLVPELRLLLHDNERFRLFMHRWIDNYSWLTPEHEDEAALVLCKAIEQLVNSSQEGSNRQI